MTRRQWWILLSGVALLITAMLVDTSGSAAAERQGCAGDVVVTLDAPIWARFGHDRAAATFTTPLPPGRWSVQAVTSDAYEGRSAALQHHEQVTIALANGVVLGPTADLADGVDSARATHDLGTVVTNSDLTGFTVRHAVAPTADGTESVTINCVGFTLLESPGDGLAAHHAIDCRAGTVTVTVANRGGLTSPYLALVAGESEGGSLEPGGSVDLVGPAGADPLDLRVAGPAGVVLEEHLPPPCPPPTTTVPPSTTEAPPTTVVPPTTVAPPTTVVPSTTRPPVATRPPAPARLRAAASVDCAGGQVMVLMANDGDLDAVVDVALPLASVRSGVVVRAGDMAAVSLGLGPLDDGTREVRISDTEGGAGTVRVPVVVDCAEPASPRVTTVLDCEADVVRVRLANRGGEAAALTVLVEQDRSYGTFDLDGGEDTEVEIPLAGAERVPVRVVTAAGDDVFRLDVDNGCAGGSAGGGEDADGTVSDPGSGPRLAQTACDAVEIDDEGPFSVRVEVDGTVVVDGTGEGRTVIPVVPGVPTKVVVAGSGASDRVLTTDGHDCADATVTIAPDCEAGRADVTIERDGEGRERFLLLVDQEVAGAMVLDGTDAGTVPVPIGAGSAELTVARSQGGATLAGGTIRCEAPDNLAGPVSASLVAVAVLASAAGVIPWPPRRRAA